MKFVECHEFQAPVSLPICYGYINTGDSEKKCKDWFEDVANVLFYKLDLV